MILNFRNSGYWEFWTFTHVKIKMLNYRTVEQNNRCCNQNIETGLNDSGGIPGWSYGDETM